MTTTIAPTCEIAEILSTIERRLREKCKQATSEFLMGGYAQAALEICREHLEHYRHCTMCQRLEVEVATERRAA